MRWATLGHSSLTAGRKHRRQTLRRLLGAREGVSAVEYALLAALIAAVIVATVAVLGGFTHGAIDKAADCFDNPASC